LGTSTEQTVTTANVRDAELSFLPLQRRSLSLAPFSLVLGVLALLLQVHSKLNISFNARFFFFFFTRKA
jgi:hypothetical protein